MCVHSDRLLQAAPHTEAQGGIATFLRWRGLDPTDYGAFYDTSSQVHADFQLYIRTLLSRNNTITGIPWGRDPAIAAWETGNELGGWERKAMPPAEWTSSVAKTVRALAPATLVVDGTYGLNEEAMALPEIDIVTNVGFVAVGQAPLTACSISTRRTRTGSARTRQRPLATTRPT
jgi:endo-1,4-beta-mannosidase